MTELVKFPMMQTYLSKGMSKDEIMTDAVMTIQENVMNMSDSERVASGIGTDFLTYENLYAMWDNKQIKFNWNNQSKKNNPTYNISIDPDGSGMFVNIADPNNPSNAFQPQSNRIFKESLSLEQTRGEYNNKKWIEWFGNNVKKKEYIQNNPNPYYERYGIEPKDQPKFNSTLKGLFDLTLGAINKGKNGVEDLGRMFNDIEWLPNIAPIDMNTIERLTQENQLDFLSYQKSKQSGALDDSFAAKYSGGVETAMGVKQVGTNLFYDFTKKHEGGYYPNVYDTNYKSQTGYDGENMQITGLTNIKGLKEGQTTPMASEGSKVTLEQYEYMKSENGDPTIGTGLSLKDKDVIQELESLGYNIDNLMKGTETLSREDDVTVVSKIMDNKLQLVERITGIEDLRTNKNAYLAVALVDLAYNSPTWIGPRFKRALKKFIETGDLAHIGTFDSYNEGSGKLVFAGDNYSNINKYEPALLNELWNDAEGMAEKGYGGFRTRFGDVAGLIQAWSQGQYTYFPELNKKIEAGTPLDSQ